MRPTPERVREALAYDSETGVFVWQVSLGRVRAGAIAGTPHKGYCRITIDKHHYGAHQLAWLYVTGEWPPGDIDHIDGDPLNNRFANLRLADSTLNKWNVVAPQTNNSSGYRGVSRSWNKWVAHISVDGHHKYLGSFDTPEAASEAYWVAKAEHHGAEAYQGRLEATG